MMLRNYTPPCLKDYERYYASCRCDGGTDKWYCALFKHKILYFPKSSENAKKVMDLVSEQLRNFGNFIEKGPTENEQYQIKSENKNLYQVIQSILKKFRGCFEDPSDRIIGFETRAEVLEYTKELSKNGSDYLSDVPGLWGILSFAQDAEKADANQNSYRIIYNAQSKSKIENQIPWLQDFVENAIIQLKKGGKKMPSLGISMKSLPNKCWIIPDEKVYEALGLLIQAVAVFSFILSPSNFLEQVLTEKSLKLREYLYIMGVGDFKLKFSWILFYALFLFPMSILFAVFISNMPGPSFRRSDTSLLFVLVIMYNISQLSFCYLLACVLKKPRRTGILIMFLNSFFWFLAAFLFRGSDMTGTTVTLARVCCLYCVTPMAICFSYLVNWEKNWVGAKWINFFYSPNMVDEFGGFGECFLWLIGDTILYLLIAWYLERVIPGEFGVKHPPYFFLLPSYWCPSRTKNRYHSIVPDEQPDVEALPEGAEAGVILQSLTKMYGRDKVGVNKLNLKFLKNEITAFLGENGAGKSTTMNTLVGLISATDGKAVVHDLDTETQMIQIRKIVGFVPQYDILYPSMTVQEHLQFFGWLKGLSKSEIQQLTDPLLGRLDLLNQKNVITTKLSGGQKRKLSILTAYLGEPEVVILDEPTSGVDPFSRRTIWEMILTRRKSGTTILSTHFMEEADILGDRVAIIATGELRCCGTSMYLKNRYGKGLSLTAACVPGQDKTVVKEFFRQNIPEGKVLQEKGSDITFSIPIESHRSGMMVNFLRKFEDSQPKMGVISYGLSEPTLEEVFFSATESQYDVYHEPADFENVENGEGIQLTDRNNESQQTSDKISYPKMEGFLKHAWQAWGLMQKKILYTVLSWSGYLLQVILPLAFIILLLLIGKQTRDSGATVQNVHIWEHYRENVIFFQDAADSANSYISSAVKNGFEPRCPGGMKGYKCNGPHAAAEDSLLKNPQKIGLFENCSCSMDYCTEELAMNQPNQVIKSTDRLFRVGTGTNITQWLTRVNNTRQTPVGGFQFLQMNESRWNDFLEDLESQFPGHKAWTDLIKHTTPLSYVTIWHKNNLGLAMKNIWSNLLMKKFGGDNAEIKFQVESATLVDIRNDFAAQFKEYFSIILSCFFLTFCFGFGTFGIAVFVQYENSTGLKRLQLLFGANPIIYWTVNLICDFLLYMVTVAVVMIFLSAFDNSFQNSLGPLFAVVVPYGFLSITFIYLLSFLFKGSKGIVIFTVVSFLVVQNFGLIFSIFELVGDICIKMCETEECKENCNTFPWAAPVASVLRIIPAYFINDGIILIAVSEIMNNVQGSFGGAVKNPFDPIMGMEFLGKRILTAFIAGIAYFIIAIILESLDIRLNIRCCRTKTLPAANRLSMFDEDVQAETARVQQNPNLDDPLILRNLSKTYRGVTIPAVAGVTLGVPRSQCFGLLGINGAGKTTLFRMLTGFLRPTTGGAILEKKDLFTRGWGRLSGASYCPQENTLFDSLTVERHLSLFAKIRGIPRSHAKEVIDCLVKEVGLTSHLGKRASELSGGNQRKLQFALALMDYCPVIFLDEPTTGMDPGARRNAWDLIKRAVDRNCSVVLTSHSMEECEALCHRIVIMVAGSFQCIGSVQYLKDKFGNRYTFKLKLSHGQDGGTPRDGVKQFIHGNFPMSSLIEEHSSMLHFEVPAPGLRLSELFRVLNECKEHFPIEDFAVSQTTLEHVFINMARMQEMLHSGFAVQVQVPQQQPAVPVHGFVNPMHNPGVPVPRDHP